MAQIYKTGGSGKNYVYNPDNGNIMVNGRVVQKGSNAYNSTYKAMTADTGYDFSGNSNNKNSNNSIVAAPNNTPATITQAPNTTPATVTQAGKDVITNPAGGTTTNGYGNGMLMRDNNGDIIRNENGVSYREPAGTAKNQYLSNELAANNGGIYRSGTIDNPTGYSNIQKLYGDYLEKALAANNGLKSSAVKTLQDSIGTTNQEYGDRSKELYAQYMANMKSLPQLLAASGLGRTGVSETSRTGLMSSYMNNLNSNEKSRISAIQNIMNQIAEKQAEAEGKNADIYGNYADMMSQYYYNMLNNDQSNAMVDRDWRTGLTQQSIDNSLAASNLAYDTGNYYTGQDMLENAEGQIIENPMAAPQPNTNSNTNTNKSNKTTASNGQVYMTGGSGKQYVYNPATGNIAVTANGVTKYVKPTDSTYQATKNAMNSDTGSKY